MHSSLLKFKAHYAVIVIFNYYYHLVVMLHYRKLLIRFFSPLMDSGAPYRKHSWLFVEAGHPVFDMHAYVPGFYSSFDFLLNQ